MAPTPHALLVPSFDVRLERVLADAARELALDWIAVADFDAPSGSARLRWRAGFPKVPARAPTPEDVERWSGSSAAGEPFAVVLRVEPALSPGPDAVLVWAATERPSASDLASLVECLEIGLTDHRRAMLARWVFTAVDAAPDLVEITDREARFVYANRAWQAAFGLSPPEFLGRTPRLLRPQADPGVDQAFLQFSIGAIERGEPWLGTLANRTARGDSLVCEVAVTQFDAGDASFAGNVAVRRNLAHRSAREAALMAAHREFREVLAALPDGVVVLRDDRIYFVNAAFLALADLDEGAVIRRPITDLLHPDDADAIAARTRGAKKLRIMRPNGTSRLADAAIAGAISFEGAASTIVILRDHTEQKVAEERLAHGEKITALGMLAAGVAHEINNPLAFIALSLELLEEEADDPVARAGLLRDASEGVDRIRRIAESLRSFSAVDPASEPETVDLGNAIGSAINLTANEIRHRARLVRRDAPRLCVLAREGPLVQVLVVVLTNAAQAIPVGSSAAHEIVVESRACGNEVEITIADTGVGVPEALRDRIFEPFITTKPRDKGTGLGLAIARRIVHEARGSIRLDARAGGGTLVTITLPRALGPPAASTRASRAPATSPASTAGRVLIIDDEDAVARVAARLLREHEVTVANDGATAMEALRRSDFGAVLCDLMMPDTSGAQIYAQAIAMRPSLAKRFVFITGGVFTEEARAFVETVTAQVVTKPFDADTLRHSVARVLRA